MNFLKFKPGLVGGHCLPVDPYYLSYYAKKLGLNTQITLAARKTNNSMEEFIINKIISNLKEIDKLKKRKMVIMGLTYKSNVPDYRNSLAVNIYKKLKKTYKNIKAYDPIIEKSFVRENNIKNNFNEIIKSEVFILLVKHKQINEVIKFAKKNKKILLDPISLLE